MHLVVVVPAWGSPLVVIDLGQEQQHPGLPTGSIFIGWAQRTPATGSFHQAPIHIDPLLRQGIARGKGLQLGVGLGVGGNILAPPMGGTVLAKPIPLRKGLSGCEGSKPRNKQQARLSGLEFDPNGIL